mgnify:CR=1 FL=1
MATKMRIASLPFLLLLALAAVDISAGDSHPGHEGEHRGHGVHVHGRARLNIVLEGSEIHVGLNSPAANLVGFEHAPSSEADHAALDRTLAALRDGARLFEFNGDAGCSMTNVEIVSALIEEAHAGHEHDATSDHGHKEHEHEDEAHTDVDAAYHFECAKPGKLERLNVELFEVFPGTEHLTVQFVIGDQQGAAELTPDDHVVAF